MGWSLEALKHKIHSTKFPIKSKRAYFAVQCLYFAAPIVVGYGVMQWVMPDPDEVRRQMKPPSELALAMAERNKRGMQEALDAAKAARDARLAAAGGGAGGDGGARGAR